MNFIKEVSTKGRSKLSDKEKRHAEELLEKSKDEDSKLVKGIFKNLECPGGDLEFAFHQYKGDSTKIYHLIDGHEYEIPMGVAKHLNRQCKYKKSKYLVDKDGNRMITADKPIERYQFVSTDFM